MKYIQLTQGQQTMVDDDLYDWLNQWKWHYRKRSGNRKGGDAVRTAHGIDKDGHDKVETVYMAHTILPVPTGFMVDHADVNPLNNQRNNLRKGRAVHNNRNSRVRVNNTLGVKGVHWSERKQQYIAQISVDYKKIWLGGYKTVEEAKKAYEEGVKKYHGKFGRTI